MLSFIRDWCRNNIYLDHYNLIIYYKTNVDWAVNQLGHLGGGVTLRQNHQSRGMRFQTMWYVRPAKAQTSLRIRAD